MITVLPSFVGLAAARLACMMAACAGLVLLTPAPASRHLDASSGLNAFVCQARPDPAGDGEWTKHVVVDASDSCDDDDGDDDPSTPSGQVTFGREHVGPDFSYSAHVIGVTAYQPGSRSREAHRLRGPPVFAKESSGTTDGAPHPCSSASRRGANCREPHLRFLCNPFRRASARSDYRLRAPP